MKQAMRILGWAGAGVALGFAAGVVAAFVLVGGRSFEWDYAWHFVYGCAGGSVGLVVGIVRGICGAAGLGAVARTAACAVVGGLLVGGLLIADDSGLAWSWKEMAVVLFGAGIGVVLGVLGCYGKCRAVDRAPAA